MFKQNYYVGTEDLQKALLHQIGEYFKISVWSFHTNMIAAEGYLQLENQSIIGIL